MPIERMDQLHSVARHLPDFHFRRVTAISNCARHDEVVIFSLLLGRLLWFLLGGVIFFLLLVVLLFFVLSNMLSPSTGPKKNKKFVYIRLELQNGGLGGTYQMEP